LQFSDTHFRVQTFLNQIIFRFKIATLATYSGISGQGMPPLAASEMTVGEPNPLNRNKPNFIFELIDI